MGFFSRKPKKPSNDAGSCTHIDGPGSFPVRVVGEQHYQDNLSKICGSSTRDEDECITSAILIHDDKNPYDDKAIRVEIDGKHVGHLGKAEARSYRERMAADGNAGARATCKAKIGKPSDRLVVSVDAEGAVARLLCVALDLPRDFVEPLSRDTPVTMDTAQAAETGTFSFRAETPPAEELVRCQAGDEVSLWVPSDSPGIVYVSRPGAIGKRLSLGRIPSQFAKVVSEHLSGGWLYEAKIASVESSSCTIECKLVSREETAAKREEALRKTRASLKKELLRNYVPKESLTLSVQLPKDHGLVEGEELVLRNRGLDHYIENAASLEIEFADKKGDIVANASSPSGAIKSILRASFSDMPMTMKLVDIERPEKSTLPYLKSVRGKVEVDFK